MTLQPKLPRFTLSELVLIPLGMILLGALALLVVRVFDKPAVADETIVADRLQRLAEYRERSRGELSGYAWADKEAGQVRIPLEQAQELVLPELQSKPVQASSVPWEEPVSPTPPIR